MTTSSDLIDRMGLATKEEVATFAAACATRISPIIVAYSHGGEGSQLNEWLRELWSLALSPNRQEANELGARVASSPLTRVDDSNRSDFYAMRALSVLDYAVQVQTSQDPLKLALWCSRATISLLRDLDYILGNSPSSAESLANLEVLAEEAWIATRSGRLDPLENTDGLEWARDSNVYRTLNNVLPEIARRRGWEITNV